MAIGIIASLKNESTGFISRGGGQADIVFHREDFSGEWNRSTKVGEEETIIGKQVSFSSTQDENGRLVARSVKLV